jgi:hypothetical protein
MPDRAPTVVGGPWTCDSCSRTLGVTTVQEVVRAALDRIKVGREQDNQAILALVEELGQTRCWQCVGVELHSPQPPPQPLPAAGAQGDSGGPANGRGAGGTIHYTLSIILLATHSTLYTIQVRGGQLEGEALAGVLLLRSSLPQTHH